MRTDFSYRATAELAELRIYAGEEEVWASEGVGAVGDGEILLRLGESGVLLRVEGKWRGDPGRAALELEVFPDGMAERRVSFWSEGGESLSFQEFLAGKEGGDE